MVLPGWNVTEPLQVAWKFYNWVRNFRDADDEIKTFAVQVESFCDVLKALDECLKNPDSTPLHDDDPLKVASDGCKRCAEHCKKFVNHFFRQFNGKIPDAPTRDDVGPSHRLNWMWKKDEATKLALEMNRQIHNINLHISIAERQVRLQ